MRGAGRRLRPAGAPETVKSSTGRPVRQGMCISIQDRNITLYR